MAEIRAVILAAGMGSRLGGLTEDRPKCLIEIGGKPLIKHQLDALADHGIGPVLLVLGCRAEAVREVIGDGADYVVNSAYERTNSLYSLWLAREWVEGPFVLLNCDLLFHPDILDRVLEHEGNVLAYDSTSSGGREQTKVAIRDGRVLDLGKDLPNGASRGENLGLLKFDAKGARGLFESVEALIDQGHERTWVTEAVRTICSSVPIKAVNVAGLPWAEIDFPYDLERARREVWPAMAKVRPTWRRLRWAALGLLGVGLASAGWLSSSQVGPASVDWETVTPTTGTDVTLTRKPSGSQRWWLTDGGDSVAALLQGPGAVRVEYRYLLAPRSRQPGKYVVEVSVDGESFDWKVLKATPDSSAALPGYVVGDRDRMKVELSPGVHILAVKLLAGTGEGLLTRIREAE